MHENPIPSVHDLFGNLGITGFIWSPEVTSAKIEKVEEKTDPNKENNLSPSWWMIDRKSSPHPKNFSPSKKAPVYRRSHSILDTSSFSCLE